eukprot:4331565-Prymnesium_polylepis.2
MLSSSTTTNNRKSSAKIHASGAATAATACSGAWPFWEMSTWCAISRGAYLRVSPSRPEWNARTRAEVRWPDFFDWTAEDCRSPPRAGGVLGCRDDGCCGVEGGGDGGAKGGDDCGGDVGANGSTANRTGPRSPQGALSYAQTPRSTSRRPTRCGLDGCLSHRQRAYGSADRSVEALRPRAS